MSEEKDLYFEKFKFQLVNFITNNTNHLWNQKMVKKITDVINNSESEKDLYIALKDENETLYTVFGGEIPEHDDDDYQELKDDMEKVENELEDLNGELEELKNVFGKSLDDEFKMEALLEHHKKYRYWELEELLKNGKNYLKG